jgi:hypothetical protein
MPNLDAPNGFVPVRHLNGGTVRYTGGYTIDSGQASDIFLGDAVIADATPTGDGNNIDVAGAGGELLGIFAGCQYTAANGDVVWAKQWVSGTTTLGAAPAEAFVYVDPQIVYSVQVAGTIAAADIGNFADLVVGAGNTLNGVSGFELNATTAGTIAQFQILSLAEAPDGIFTADISSANPRVLVQIAESPYRAWPGAVS